MVDNEQKEQIKNLLEKINEELDLLARYLEQIKINYKPTLMNLETNNDGDGKYYKELKIQLELIEKM